MTRMNFDRYRPFPPVSLTNRQWPGNTITAAPMWCSVDLRDGNQALRIPMNVEEKLKLFELKGINGSYRKFMNLYFESVNNFSNDT